MSDDCASNRWTDLGRASSFDDVSILRIADAQVRNSLRIPIQTAAQRSYNCIVRREIRKRGLKWSPPTG